MKRMRRMAPSLVVACGLCAALLAAGPLDARVSVNYRDASAGEVFRALASGAGLTVQTDPGTLQPVTITLTNVKLSNALNAVCDSASCSWRLDNGLHITPLPRPAAGSLPPYVSFHVRDARGAEAFHALGDALGVGVAIDLNLATERVNFNFDRASTTEVLNLLCNYVGCEWDYDAAKNVLSFARKR
jgi:hypothetical protein